MFDEKQIEFMDSMGLDFTDLSDENLEKIEDVISEKLQKSGFDENYNVTDIGKMCESILDILCLEQ